MRRLPLLLLALAAPSVAAAQHAGHATPPHAAAAGEKMAPFAWLVGEWRGSGWFAGPNGARSTFESRETVTTRLSGNALLVEGLHHETGNPARVVHDAIALLTWDSRANGYRFRTALASGMGGDYPVEPTADGFTWRIDTPGGQIVYTVTHERGEWVERGSRTGPDGRAVDFFEMRLRKH